jgi:hypothetical protein
MIQRNAGTRPADYTVSQSKNCLVLCGGLPCVRNKGTQRKWTSSSVSCTRARINVCCSNCVCVREFYSVKVIPFATFFQLNSNISTGEVSKRTAVTSLNISTWISQCRWTVFCEIRTKSFKTLFSWHIKSKSYTYFTGTIHLRYKVQRVNDIYGNNCCLWETYETYKHTGWAEFLNGKADGATVVTRSNALKNSRPTAILFYFDHPLTNPLRAPKVIYRLRQKTSRFLKWSNNN